MVKPIAVLETGIIWHTYRYSMSHQICIGFVEVGFVPAGWTWCIYPYSYGLLHWWRYNHIIIPVTVKKNLQDMGKIGQTNDKETWHARTICIILDVCCIQSFEINYHHDFNLRKHVVVVNRIIVTIRSTQWLPSESNFTRDTGCRHLIRKNHNYVYGIGEDKALGWTKILFERWTKYGSPFF